MWIKSLYKKGSSEVTLILQTFFQKDDETEYPRSLNGVDSVDWGVDGPWEIRAAADDLLLRHRKDCAGDAGDVFWPQIGVRQEFYGI